MPTFLIIRLSQTPTLAIQATLHAGKLPDYLVSPHMTSYLNSHQHDNLIPEKRQFPVKIINTVQISTSHETYYSISDGVSTCLKYPFKLNYFLLKFMWVFYYKSYIYNLKGSQVVQYCFGQF
jgi:hypothetical protein